MCGREGPYGVLDKLSLIIKMQQTKHAEEVGKHSLRSAAYAGVCCAIEAGTYERSEGLSRNPGKNGLLVKFFAIAGAVSNGECVWSMTPAARMKHTIPFAALFR